MIVTDGPALVTGAGGFIGSHLVEALVARGRAVRAFVHYNSRNDWGQLHDLAPEVLGRVEVLAGDVRDARCVGDAVRGCAVVYHLAALIGVPYSFRAPASYLAANVTGTLNVLEAARAHGVPRVVHTSTSETYGSAQYVPMNEKHPLAAQSPYAASKIAADQFALSFHHSYSLPITVVRPFNTYGPRQSARAIVATIICQALHGGVVRLGALTPVRDLTYVADTVAGFIAAADCDQAIGRIINLGTGQGVTIGDLAQTIIGLVGEKAIIVRDEQRIRPGASEVDRLVADTSLARELIGWRPRVGLMEGLKRTIDYVREHLDAYKPGVYNV